MESGRPSPGTMTGEPPAEQLGFRALVSPSCVRTCHCAETDVGRDQEEDENEAPEYQAQTISSNLKRQNPFPDLQGRRRQSADAGPAEPASENESESERNELLSSVSTMPSNASAPRHTTHALSQPVHI